MHTGNWYIDLSQTSVISDITIVSVCAESKVIVVLAKLHSLSVTSRAETSVPVIWVSVR